MASTTTSPVMSPRSSHGRKFSFGGRSDKSRRSSSSANKIHLTESTEEKRKRSLHTKADPMVAMNEAQPMAVALEQSTMGSLRALQHKDQYGNIINDPDLSNPTRPRFERPLDTIRSFEAAIYGTYNSRPVSWARTESPAGGENTRGSYYGESSRANGYYSNRGYHDQGGFYNGRGTYSRQESYASAYSSQAQDNGYYPYNQGGGQRPRRNPRMYSEQGIYNNGSNGYAQHSYQRSYDNVAVASGSGPGNNTDPWGTSTDPSSVNSSVDQFSQLLQFGQQGRNSQLNFNVNAPTNTSVNVPADSNAGGPVGGTPAGATATTHHQRQKSANIPDAGKKRKSWLRRKFSKN